MRPRTARHPCAHSLEFPHEHERESRRYRQFMFGSDILLTPVLTTNVSSFSDFLPSHGQVIWGDRYPQHRESEELASYRQKRKKRMSGFNTRTSAAAPYALFIFLSREASANGTFSSVMAIRRGCWCTTRSVITRKIFFQGGVLGVVQFLGVHERVLGRVYP